MSEENDAYFDASYQGLRRRSLTAVFAMGFFTLGVYPIIWFHSVMNEVSRYHRRPQNHIHVTQFATISLAAFVISYYLLDELHLYYGVVLMIFNASTPCFLASLAWMTGRAAGASYSLLASDQQSVSPPLHVVLTLLTVGLWLPFAMTLVQRDVNQAIQSGLETKESAKNKSNSEQGTHKQEPDVL